MVHCISNLLIGIFNIQWNPDFSKPWFPEPPDISNQTLFPLDLLHSSSTILLPISRTLDFSKLSITRTCENFQTHLVRMSITFTPLNKLALPDKLFSRILITQQASHKSVISLKGKMTASDYQHSLNWVMQSVCLTHSASVFC